MRCGVRWSAAGTAFALLLVAGCSREPGADEWARPQYCPVDEPRLLSILESMSLEDKAGQVLLAAGTGKASGADADTVRNIVETGIGGVFLQPLTGIQMEPADTARLIRSLQEAAVSSRGIPLFVTLDQEGGHAAALNILNGGTDTPGSMALGQTRDPRRVFDCFDVMGEELAALGFNMDFAPVLDILPDDRNGAMNTRGFGAEPGLVSNLTPSAIWGLQNHRVFGTVKHTPGIGLTGVDTHQDLPAVQVTEEEFRSGTLVPFRRALEAGAEAMMTGHVVYPAIDPDFAASMSSILLRDLIRGELGFQGLMVTDSIGMAGARLGAGTEVPTVRALVAGNDMVLVMDSTFEELDRQRTEIIDAVGEGRLSESDLDDAVRRILALKMKACAFESPLPDVGAVGEHLATERNAARAQDAADDSIVLLREEPGVLPLSPARRILYVGPGKIYQDPGSGWMNMVDRSVGDILESHARYVNRIELVFPPDPEQATEYLALVEQADVVVIATINAHYSPEQREFFAPLFPADRPVILLTLGVPYDAWSFPVAGTVLNVTGQRSVSLIAAGKVLFGQMEARGQSAVDMAE